MISFGFLKTASSLNKKFEKVLSTGLFSNPNAAKGVGLAVGSVGIVIMGPAEKVASVCFSAGITVKLSAEVTNHWLLKQSMRQSICEGSEDGSKMVLKIPAWISLGCTQ